MSVVPTVAFLIIKIEFRIKKEKFQNAHLSVENKISTRRSKLDLF